MRAWTVAALLSLVSAAGCLGAFENDSEVTLLIDFNGQNPIGTHDIFIDMKFDSDDRPSAGAYEGKDVEHPDGYTAHDLLVEWEGAKSLVFTYYEGIGYSLDSILGVEAGSDPCWFWAFELNGEASLSGLGTTIIEDGDAVALRFTDCSPAEPEPVEDVPSMASLTFSFNGSAPDGMANNLTELIQFDPDARPSATAYNESTIDHPDAFTVHDLLMLSAHAGNVTFGYFDGIGYSLDSVHGVASNFTAPACLFWELLLNGEPAMEGLSLAQVQADDSIVWRYSDCS